MVDHSMTAVTAPARTDATPAAAAPAAPGPAQRGEAHARRRVLPDRTRALGTYLFMVADAMVLATIVAAYFAIKDGSSAWPPTDVGVGTYIPFIVTITLTMAAASAQWAINAMRQNDQRNVTIALIFTIFLAVATANAEWAAFGKAGFGVGDHAYGTFYFVLFGFHLAPPAGGHRPAGVARRTVAGSGTSPPTTTTPCAAASCYFQYTNAVWYAVATVLFVFSRVNG